MKDKPIAVFDVDGTQFKSACVEKAIEVAIQQDVFNPEMFEESYAKRRLWQANNNEGVYQSYLNRLVGAFVSSIAGVEVERFQTVIDTMVDQQRVRLFGYTRQLAQILKPSHSLVAISGSPEIIVAPFLEGLGFDTIVGSTFETENGNFTGQAKSIKKGEVLDEILAPGQLVSVATGDTVGDTPVLERAICPIAFNPSATFRATAIAHGWPIVMEQKDAITQLIPSNEGYQVVFDRAPTIVLDAAGIRL